MQAVIQYGKIVTWLEMEYGLSEKESKASDAFLLAAFLNLAMCYLKLREYIKAVECCDKVQSAWGALPTPHSFPPPSPLGCCSFFSAKGQRVSYLASCIYVWEYLFLSRNWEIQKGFN